MWKSEEFRIPLHVVVLLKYLSISCVKPLDCDTGKVYYVGTHKGE